MDILSIHWFLIWSFLSINTISSLSKVGFMPLQDKYSTPQEAYHYYYRKNRQGFNCWPHRCIIGLCWRTCACGCLCFPGFGGPNCDRYIGACTEEAQRRCKPFLCMDDPRKTSNYSCACPEGWTYETDPDNSGCVDVDECTDLSSPVCGTRQCINTQGSYKCLSTPAGSLMYDSKAPPTIPKGSYTPVYPPFEIGDMKYIEKQLLPFKDLTENEKKQILRDHYEIAAIYFYKLPLPYQLHMKIPVDNQRAASYIWLRHHY